ncbi:MAG: hypothetical protein NC084_03525 [Bacteroides sp.]|nr:orotate phosphoribosyltransferase [Roseburia sp.]MCM1461768.1 hypothetical protein [Bacteroides sp.]
MDFTMKEVKLARNKRIRFGILPGHFATNHSHVSCYIDVSEIKNSFKAARETAKELAGMLHGTPIDAILCVEGTRLIGAFLAEELSSGIHGMSAGNDINVITPEFGIDNQIILRDNIQPMIRDKQVLILVSSVSSGKSVRKTVNCIRYYGGKPVAACALFSDIPEDEGVKIYSIFGADDLPNYTSHRPSECPMCAEGRKIDALVNSFGYSRL